MPDIAAPLEQEGNVTQAVIQPAISGAEITRLSMYKADALKELAAGYDKLGAGIASGVNAALSGIGAGNSDDMARQGALAGRSAVTRDANGDIQVQPTTGELFGGGGKQYANAVSDGTQQQITTNLKSDLNEIAAKNEGNPDGLKAAIAGYLQGHTGGLGAGVAGKTALLDAQDYGQQLYDHQLSRKAATDIGQAKGALQGTIDQTQGDLVALAQGGMAGSDEFAKTLGRQSDAYNSLTGNPAFGVSRDMADQNRQGNSLAVTSATIQGSMATAFKDGGINAAAAVIPAIDDHPGASDADKVQLKTAASAYLQKLQASNKTAIAANSDAFDAWNKAGENGAKPPLDVLQGIHNQAVALGDPDTAAKTSVAIATHNYSNATSGLSPSQHDAINGVGQPAPSGIGQPTTRANFFSSGRAAQAGLSFDPNNPDLTTVTAANGLTAQVNKFAAPAFSGFIKDLEARGYDINDLSGYNNREKRGGTTLSEHAFGNAIDINPSQNTFGGNKTNLPPDVSQLAHKWGLSWGGDWQGKKDFMHFEWAGPAPGGAPGLALGAPSAYTAPEAQLVASIRAGATSAGVDPNVMEGIYRGEGRAGYVGDHGSSFGPFQLHMGGLASGANAVPGMGDDFKKETGLDPRDPKTVPQQITWVASKLKADPSLISQFHGYQGPAMAASGALPAAPTMTWDDLKNNPYASAAYARTLAADETTRTRTGGALIDSSVRGMQNGSMPSQQTMVQIEQLAADNPKLADKYEKYETELGGHALANQSFAPIGGGAGGQPLIDQARAAAVAQPDILQRQIVDKAQEIRDKSERTLKDNPVAAALNGRWIGRAPAPLDPANPQSYAQHFADNAAVVNAIAAREPNADKSAVFPNELGAVQGIASGGTLQQKVALLGNIARLPSPIREATFAKIASTGAEGAVMAQAGAVAQGSPETAQDILQGQAILKTEPRFAPPAKDMLPAFAKALPPMDFPATGARGRFLDAAKAYYAAQSAKINDTSEVLDNDRWKQAVNAVTGGVLDHNGTKVIAPVYGMSQGDFDAKISGLTDADMQGAMLGGRQFPAIGLAKAGWFTSNPYHLQTLDPDAGTYLVMGGAKGSPSIVNDGAGRPLILNLRTPAGTMQAQQ